MAERDIGKGPLERIIGKDLGGFDVPDKLESACRMDSSELEILAGAQRLPDPADSPDLTLTSRQIAHKRTRNAVPPLRLVPYWRH
ncbi:MAG: hypothetical protein ACD_38C00165G0016 [uncultured bacterium]|uniref:Uncharacterized protein n=1 Tax=Candidatus Daviesbacteria bacterium GW2011_GWC2_40_12 TaxID=1618431 RepID=A0A0G0QPU3_9BACT|nr:MAG: hypothetical protein ACD_38C00165G0016 [uncultured bacterium]KKQ85410.1 MAG: hypothetical protein UT04_C0004G0028 [Candidatus Daviesbacteria bacterium GW2011_GWF2_38_7]KKR17048.1 MAG: hypothetical protein UT45_C0003G0078 [Candidatus Daviesbacteria bacterium GW2011_GWA2_39_33]KKR23994.1 MAG: hypothetical protein UT54_C0034G0002 [Candidatus Daviesbacteria bacterium GW2011_GWB1_39_5]KKR42113.1 MAG: hypothetical protein UT77_C0004G0097 [Candidatus Daviesbacteria bacterium GW2011_GWC2_40_12]